MNYNKLHIVIFSLTLISYAMKCFQEYILKVPATKYLIKI